MGGWCEVVETMPVNNGSFESSAYMKRFETMYKQASADLVLRRHMRTQLTGMHDLSTPAGLLGHTTAPVNALEVIEQAGDAPAYPRERARS